MIKVTRETKIDLKQTLIVNAKQMLHDHGPRVVHAVDEFFVNH